MDAGNVSNGIFDQLFVIAVNCNWFQDWFVKAAQTKCNQAVVITENNVEVMIHTFAVYRFYIYT